MRLAVHLDRLNLPFREAIDAVARVKVSHVAFDAVGDLAPRSLSQTGRRQIRHLLSTRELSVAWIGCPTKRSIDDPIELDRRIEYLSDSLEAAYSLGAPAIVHQGGEIPVADDLKRRAHFLDTLDRVDAATASQGARCVFHVGRNEPTAWLEALPSGRRSGLALAISPAASIVRGGDPNDDVLKLGSRVAAAMAQDVVRTGSTVSGFRAASVGDGEVDWPSWLAALSQIGFIGPLTIDLSESGFADRAGRLNDLVSALRFFRNSAV
jgi:sugar phosphate isomerase/epimerase